MNIIKFILMLLWQLPQSIVGWAMLLFFKIFGKVKLIGTYKETFIYEADLMSGAISLGTIIICSKSCAKNIATIQHECGHVERSRRIGWLYLIVIGIPSICWAAIYRRLGFKNYYQFYTEADANKLGYVEVVNRGDYYYIRRIKNIVEIVYEC